MPLSRGLFEIEENREINPLMSTNGCWVSHLLGTTIYTSNADASADRIQAVLIPHLFLRGNSAVLDSSLYSLLTCSVGSQVGLQSSHRKPDHVTGKGKERMGCIFCKAEENHSCKLFLVFWSETTLCSHSVVYLNFLSSEVIMVKLNVPRCRAVVPLLTRIDYYLDILRRRISWCPFCKSFSWYLVHLSPLPKHLLFQ